MNRSKVLSIWVKLLILITLNHSIESGVIWYDRNQIRTGSIIIFADNYQTNESALGSFTKTLTRSTTPPVETALTISHLGMEQSASMGYKIQFTTNTYSDITFNIQLVNNTVWSTLSLDYISLVTDDSDYDVQYVTYDFSIINSGSGLRSQNYSIQINKPYFNAQSHQMLFTIFLSGFQIDNSNGSYYYFDWNKYYNRTHYTIQFVTADNNHVKFVDFLFLGTDQYLRLYLRTFRLGSILEITCDENQVCPNNYVIDSIYHQENRQAYGLAAWNISKSQSTQIQYFLDSDYYSDISQGFLNTGFQYLKISFLYTVFRDCSLAGQYFEITTNQCDAVCSHPDRPLFRTSNKNCIGCSYACSTCSQYGDAFCTSCPSTRQTSAASISFECICNDGYLDTGALQCQLCSNFIIGCVNCSSYTQCQECDTGMQLNADSSKCQCTDTSLTLSNYGQCISSKCLITVLAANGSAVCSLCNTAANFMLDSTFQCVCKLGSQLKFQASNNSFYCEFICGNGIRSQTEQCDDNNTVDGDGCSSTCTVESEYVCIGWYGQISICSSNSIDYSLSYIGALRQGTENRISLYFVIKPYQQWFEKLYKTEQFVKFQWGQQHLANSYESNFINLAIQPFTYTDTQANLKVSLNYYSDIDETIFHKIYANLTNSQWSAIQTTANFQITPINYPLQYSQDYTYYIPIIIILFVVLTLVLGFLSTFTQRWIGIQLVQYAQMLYFSMFCLESFSYSLINMIKYLKYMNGPNDIGYLSYFDYSEYYNNKLFTMGYSKELIHNFNYTLIILSLPVLLLIVHFINQFAKSRKRNKYAKYKINHNQHYSLLQEQSFVSKYSSMLIKRQYIFGSLFLFICVIISNQIIFSLYIDSSQSLSAKTSHKIVSQNGTFWLLQFFNYFICCFGVLIIPTSILVLRWLNQEDPISPEKLEQLKSLQNKEKSKVIDETNNPNNNFQLNKAAYAQKIANRLKAIKQSINTQLELVFIRFGINYSLSYILMSYAKISLIAIFFKQQYGVYILMAVEVCWVIALIVWRPYKNQNPSFQPNQNSKPIKYISTDFLTEDDILPIEQEKKYFYTIHNISIVLNSFYLIGFYAFIIFFNEQNSDKQSQNTIGSLMCYWIIITMGLNIVMAVLRMFFGYQLGKINCKREKSDVQKNQQLELLVQKNVKKNNKNRKKLNQRVQQGSKKEHRKEKQKNSQKDKNDLKNKNEEIQNDKKSKKSNKQEKSQTSEVQKFKKTMKKKGKTKDKTIQKQKEKDEESIKEEKKAEKTKEKNRSKKVKRQKKNLQED